MLQEIDNYLNDEVENRFRFMERRAHSFLKKGRKLKANRRFLKVQKLHKIPETHFTPVYKDTLLYNFFLEKKINIRIKEIVLKHENEAYKVKLCTRLDDFFILKGTVAKVIIPVFVVLAGIVVIINFVLSGFFLKPFYKILEQVKTYKVGKKNDLHKISTTTDEFIKMQFLFIAMVNRIEDDYKKLKEYTENMAHEVQTPLTVMRNKVLELMADEELMKKKAGLVKLLYDEINYLSTLGSTLNLLTKIENNEFRNSKKLDTATLLKELCLTYQELAELKNIDFELKIIENHSMVIDPELFRIMLDNILRNALRYTSQEGPIKIYSDKYLIQVSNYGKKLDIEPEKIFERFVTSNNGVNSVGLGLSIVKKICDLNNIEIVYKFEDNQHIFELKSNYFSD